MKIKRLRMLMMVGGAALGLSILVLVDRVRGTVANQVCRRI